MLFTLILLHILIYIYCFIFTKRHPAIDLYRHKIMVWSFFIIIGLALFTRASAPSQIVTDLSMFLGYALPLLFALIAYSTLIPQAQDKRSEIVWQGMFVGMFVLELTFSSCYYLNSGSGDYNFDFSGLVIFMTLTLYGAFLLGIFWVCAFYKNMKKGDET